MSAAVEAFWSQFTRETGARGEYTAWGFGDCPEMATDLGRLVRGGPKRATAGLLSDYADGSEPMPAAGDYSVILDGDGAPLCVIQTTAVEVRRFGDVDEQFAWTEGEGDRSLAYWRDAHIQFFASIGAPVSDDTEVVLERFDLVWPIPADAAS